MWVERPIEKITHDRLVKELGNGDGEHQFGLYTTARLHLIENILPQIRAVLPNLTDHGPEHVARVLDNAGQLLNIEENPHALTAMELYSLILAILFHDTGNIFGRDDHQHKVSRIYDFCRSAAGNYSREKFIVLKATEAHCGETSSGSNDTIRDLPPDPVSVFNRPVHLRSVAAVLRFADELAEGRNRTSIFMQKHKLYRKNSAIFHSYADSTTVAIDPGNNRIALTYDIGVKSNRSGDVSTSEESRIEKLLVYIYQRISKLDQERKYARHYCIHLQPLMYTTITFNFWISGQVHGLGLPQQFTLTDLVVPGETERQLYEYDNLYAVNDVIDKIKTVARGGTI